MDNMSANILRNLVASVFNVKATSIRLSGVIEPNWTGSYYSGVSYTKCSTEGIVAIHSFNPKTGFTKITGCIENEHHYNGNHDRTTYEAKGVLSDFVTGDEIFFITEFTTDEEGCEGTFYTIYKSPNFQEHWAKIEEKDIARWEQWLNS